MAILLKTLALGEVGDDVAGHEDGDADVRPQLSPQGLVEPYHRAFACLSKIWRNKRHYEQQLLTTVTADYYSTTQFLQASEIQNQNDSGIYVNVGQHDRHMAEKKQFTLL